MITGISATDLCWLQLADLADEALSLVKALGIKHYVLVGHSMGGKVAQLVASRRPEGLIMHYLSRQAHNGF